VDGAISSDPQRFTIEFAAGDKLFGKTAAGAPFVAYTRHGADDLRIRNYAVKPGDRLVDSWPLSDFDEDHYDIAVYGPNGFFRAFAGNAGDPQVDIRFNDASAQDKTSLLNGNVEIHLVNRDSRRTFSIELTDMSYKNAAQQKTLDPGATAILTVDTKRSFGWYDVSVRVAGHPQFERRYAGRVETGEWSYSDPAMGRVI
jgi:phospholipase C